MSGAARNALGTIVRGLRELLRVRWVKVLAVLALLAVGVRFGGVWVLGRTVKSLARDVGIECRWEDLDLSLLDGRGEVRFLSFVPVDESGEPTAKALVELEYAVFDLDLRALLGGRLSVRRAEVDGLDTRLEREADGTWNVEKHIDVARALSILQAEPKDEPDDAETQAGPAELRLAPPLAVAALRIQHARLHLVDRAVSPELDEVLEANVRLSNLGAADRRVRFTVTVTGGELLDGATLDGVATWEESKIALELKAHAGSFRPRPLAPYLALAWIEPRAESIEARCDVVLELEVVGERRDALQGRLALRNLGLAADGRTALRLENAWIELEHGSATRTTLPRVALEGVSGDATLDATGALELGGFALLAGPPGASASVAAEPGASWAELLAGWASLWDPARYPRWAALFARSDPAAYPWSLGELVVDDVALALVDESFEPHAELGLFVDSFAIGPIVHDPALERAPVPLHARLRAPGVAEEILIEGTLAPFAPQRGCDLTLVVEGIGLEALGPYLQRAGVEETLDGGTFRAHLVAAAETDTNGRTEGWVELEELALTGEEELFGVRSMAARELLIDPTAGLVRLGDVQIAGPRLLVARGPSRGILALGLMLGRAASDPSAGESGAAVAPVAVPGAARPAAQARRDVYPKLEIGRLAWLDTDVAFVDHSIDPPGRIAIDEMGFELLGLTLGGDPAGPALEPATFSARLVAGDLAEELRIDGTILSRPGPIDLAARLSARGEGVRGRLVAPYLRELGLEPALANGRFTGSLEATLRESDGAWHAGLSARDVALDDGETPLIGLGELALEDVTFDANGLEVGRIALLRPFAHVALEADGAFRAAGLRVLPVSPSTPETGLAAPAPARAGPVALALPVLPRGRIGAVEVRDAALRWSDARPQVLRSAGTGEEAGTPVELDLAAELVLGRIDLSGAERGTFRASLSVPGVLESLTVEGALKLAPERWTIEAGVTGQGLTGTGLVPYLPPNVRPSGDASTFQGTFRTRIEPHADGGLGVELAANEVGFWTAGVAEPAFAVASASAFIARIDPVAGRVTIDAVRTEGVELALRRDAAGVVHALGFLLDPSAAPEPIVDEDPAADDAPEAEAPRPVRRAPPRVEIAGGIDVGVDRLVLHDESLGPRASGARPIEAGFGLLLEGPCVLLDPDPRELPPIELELDAALAGIGRATVGVALAPFADPATLAVQLDAHDVRTQGLIETMPALASLVRGETETGLATIDVAVELDVRRSAPYDLGLGRAFGLDVRIAGADYFDRPGGRSYAGVDQVLIEGRVDPGRGLVQLKTVDVRNPHGFVRRDDEGVHAFGFVAVPPPPQEPARDEAQEGSADATEVGAVRAVEASLASPRPKVDTAPKDETRSGGEFRIDELLVSGIDFEIVDETGAPHLRIPLTDLDAELKRFTTRMFTEPRPVSFSAYLSSTAPEGSGERSVFGEIAVSGRVAVAPEPKGWAQVNLEGLELVPFAGLAANKSLTIEDGALDANVRVRIKSATAGKVNASIVFTDLDVAEPDGGPLSKLLSLPASLDAVLFLLKNQNDEHRFSVGFPVTEAGLSLGSMAAAAAGATAEIVARAIAGAPFRLVGGLIPGSGEPEEKPTAAWSFAFEEGALGRSRDVAGASADLEALAEIAKRLNARGSLVATLRHETAAADIERAATLANPSADECLELARGLRQRKAELLRSLDELATDARTLFAIGREDEALSTTGDLREHELRLLATEQGLDHVLGILRRDSPRQQDKRTQVACRELAEERLARLRDELATWIAKDAHDRVDVRSPRPRVVEGLEQSRIVIELRER